METFETFGVTNVRGTAAGGILRPLKVGWRSIHRNIRSIPEHFRKPADYDRWLDSIAQAERSDVVFSRALPDSEKFKEFHEFYIRKMNELPGGRINLGLDWLEKHAQAGEPTLGYWAHKSGRLVGGMIAFIDGDAIHVGFLAVEHALSGVTAGLQYQLLLDQIERKLAWIYYGKDTNLYGLALSPGLLFNKIRFGMEPFLPPEVEIVSSYFVKRPEQLPIIFYSLIEGKNELNLTCVYEGEKPALKPYYSSNTAPEPLYLPLADILGRMPTAV